MNVYEKAIYWFPYYTNRPIDWLTEWLIDYVSAREWTSIVRKLRAANSIRRFGAHVHCVNRAHVQCVSCSLQRHTQIMTRVVTFSRSIVRQEFEPNEHIEPFSLTLSSSVRQVAILKAVYYSWQQRSKYQCKLWNTRILNVCRILTYI